jgi:transposase InsO family protein
VELRKLLLLPLDDLLVVTHEFVNDTVSRSGLDRCLRRQGVSHLKDVLPREEPEQSPPKGFKDYEPGFVHVDVKYLPQMPDQDQREYLFAAIDRASRWVYVEILPTKTGKHASAFLKRLLTAAPLTITKILTDNGKEFSDRFCATGQREPTGQHAFDQLCAANGIEHRLIKPRHPQANGMIGRLNGRISEDLQTTRFRSGEHLNDTLTRYVRLYNQHIPQRALKHPTPSSASNSGGANVLSCFISDFTIRRDLTARETQGLAQKILEAGQMECAKEGLDLPLAIAIGDLLSKSNRSGIR